MPEANPDILGRGIDGDFVARLNPLLPVARQASARAMLQTQQADYRTQAIQIGFTFVESESA